MIQALQARQYLPTKVFMQGVFFEHIALCVKWCSTTILMMTEYAAVISYSLACQILRFESFRSLTGGYLKYLVYHDYIISLSNLKDCIAIHVGNISWNVLFSTPAHVILYFRVIAGNDGQRFHHVSST